MKETNLSGDDALVIGTDHFFRLKVTDDDGTVAKDLSTWSLSFMVKRLLTDEDEDALITKTTGQGITLTGTFNADPALNTQFAVAAVVPDDSVSLSPGQAWYEWKRMDVGFKHTPAKGRLPLIQGVHHA